MNGAAQDFSGASVRGGVSFSPGPSSTTLFRGQAQVGGTCGGFDFGSSFKEAIESIPDVITNMSQSLIHNAPMLVLCYSSPSLCDLSKHFQGLMNALIQARYAQCQSSQAAAMYAGLRLRGGEVSQCLSSEQQKGTTLSQALRVCNSGDAPLKNPDGSFGTEVNLIADTLRAAGASNETRTVAGQLLGEVTLRAGDAMGVSSSHPQDALMNRYETHRQTYAGALQTATEELQSTGTVTTTTLRAASVPGQALPRAAVEALAGLRNDPIRYESAIGRLSTQAALSQLTWDCSDMQEQLTAATDGNAHLSDEERRAMEQKLKAFRQALANTVAKVESGERYSAAVDTLLTEHARLLQTASDLGLRAPSVQATSGRYGAQNTIGYSR